MFFNTIIPTVLLGILIYWSSKWENGKDYFNIQLNSSYDYIIGKTYYDYVANSGILVNLI